MNIIPLPLERATEIFALYDAYNRPVDVHLSHEQSRDIVEKVRNQGGEIFVAEIDGKFVGTSSIYVCHNLARSGRPFAVIEHVICLPDYRRQGIGRQLMKHAIAYAESNDCYKVFLNTGEKSLENHTFYEACGFKGDKRGYQIRFI